MSDTNHLLAKFVLDGCEEAFQKLVASYFDLVHSTAVRLVAEDKHLAQDIAQQVFIDLARKAAALPPDVQLGGWLHRHSCFLAKKAMRSDRRRRIRERQAMELQKLEDSTEENLQRCRIVLDEVINELENHEREVLLLRFFEQLDFRSIGVILECSEDAARMRNARALHILDAALRRRGVALAVTGLAFFLGNKIISAAPIGLAARVARIGFAQASKGGISFSLIKETCFTKLNAGLAGAVAVIALIAILLAKSPRGAQTEPSTQRAAVTVVAATSPKKRELPFPLPSAVDSLVPVQPPRAAPPAKASASQRAGIGPAKLVAVPRETPPQAPAPPPSKTVAPVVTTQDQPDPAVTAPAILTGLSSNPRPPPLTSTGVRLPQAYSSATNLLRAIKSVRLLASNRPTGSRPNLTPASAQEKPVDFLNQNWDALLSPTKLVGGEESVPIAKIVADQMDRLKEINSLLDDL